jgi:hypothetical protein
MPVVRRVGRSSQDGSCLRSKRRGTPREDSAPRRSRAAHRRGDRRAPLCRRDKRRRLRLAPRRPGPHRSPASARRAMRPMNS